MASRRLITEDVVKSCIAQADHRPHIACSRGFSCQQCKNPAGAEPAASSESATHAVPFHFHVRPLKVYVWLSVGLEGKSIAMT
jgi:hypothetical protein